MAADITDFFGKASVSTDHSVSTTVTASRTAGVTVLSGFDLSTFAEDTAVYFITYKKVTDPTTGAVTVSELVSWKGIVNAGANTISNLTVAPGYVDIGNDEDDFIECIPTSYWENSMIDGILAHADQDGTLKAGAVDVAAVLASNVVTTAKIADGAVTVEKIEDAVLDAISTNTTNTVFNPGNSDWHDTADWNVDITVPTGAHDVLVEFTVVALSANTFGASVQVIRDGSTVVFGEASGIRPNVASIRCGYVYKFVDEALAAGTYNYKVQMAGAGSVSPNLNTTHRTISAKIIS